MAWEMLCSLVLAHLPVGCDPGGPCVEGTGLGRQGDAGREPQFLVPEQRLSMAEAPLHPLWQGDL